MSEMLLHAIFIVFDVVLIGSAMMVVLSQNAVKAALYLILAFVTSAGMWLLLESEFLALILVVVYVGAVMTLFLFIVMMLDLNADYVRQSLWKNIPVLALIAVMLLAMLRLVVGPQHFGLDHFVKPEVVGASHSNIADLGKLLYTDYVLHFEVAAAILFVAIIAAIVLINRDPRGQLKQMAGDQINVRAKDRIRIVKMDGHEKPNDV